MWRGPSANADAEDATVVLMFGTPAGVDSLTLPEGRTLNYPEARRNVVARGIDLNALVGRRFRVGDVECLGQRLCEPC